MYRSPGIDDDRLKWILAEINQSQRTLDERIAIARALPNTEPSKAKRIIRLNAMKREVNTSFTNLDRSIAQWAEQDVPSMYKSGWLIGATQTGTGFDFTLPHREALDIISQSAYDDVATRMQQVNSKFGLLADKQVLYEGMDPGQILAIQDKSRSAVAQALLTGEADPRKVAKGLADELWEDGVTIVDGGGNHWQMETYTRMLVRTKSANAYNAGSLNKYVEEGISRVSVYDGVLDDEACAEANGKTWSIKYATEHAIEHPNCRRAFAPKPGSGEANDPDDSEEAAQARGRSRARTAGRAWAGTTIMQQFIQALRHPEQFDTSRVLSTFAVGAVEQLTGVPLAFVDDFIAGLLARPLRQIDQMIEETINPALFAAGFAKKLPAANDLFKIKDPERLIKIIQRSILEAEANVSHIGAHPQAVSAARTIGDHAESALIATGHVTKKRAFVQHMRKSQFLRVIDIIALPHLATNRYGRIVSDVLHQWALGNDIVLKQAFKDAATTIDHMAFTRRAANDLLLATAQDAFLVRKDIDSKIVAVRQYIFKGLFAVDDPAMLARLAEADGIDYRPFTYLSEAERKAKLGQMLADLEALRAYADQRVITLVAIEARNAGASAEAIEATVRRLVLDLDEGGVTDLSAFRATRTWGAAPVVIDVPAFPATGGRKLLAQVPPPVRGTPSASAISDMADEAAMKLVARDLERALPAHVSTPFAQDVWDDIAAVFMDLYQRGKIDPADPSVQAVLGHINRTGVATELNVRVLGGVWPLPHATTHKVTKLEFLGLVAVHMESFKISGGKMFYSGTEITPTSQEFIAMREAMLGLGPDFFRRTDEWLSDISAGSAPMRILRHLGQDASIDPQRAVAEVYEQLRLKVEIAGNSSLDLAALLGSGPPNSRNIGTVLRTIYGASNVSALGSVGANGKLFKVVDQDGTAFVVKRVIYSGTGSAAEGALSYTLSGWVDNYLFGGHASVPVRLIKLNENDEYLGLMPYFEGGMWRDFNWIDDVPDSALRRTRLFDMVGQELDGHGGNYMFNDRTGVSLSIDNEMSMYAAGIVRGTALPSSDGLGIIGTHYPTTAVEKRAGRAWLTGGDERGLANGVPARLITLTDEEVEAVEHLVSAPLMASAAGVPQLVQLTPFPMLVDISPRSSTGRGVTAIAGRVSAFNALDFGGISKAHMVPTVFLSGEESKKIRALAALTPAARSGAAIEDDIYDTIGHLVFDVWSDATKHSVLQAHPAASNMDELVSIMTDGAIDMLSTRARRLLDSGLANDGAINRYVNKNGVVIEVGDTVDAVTDIGDEVQGLVIGIFRDSLGEVNIQYVTGIGMGKTATELKVPRAVRTATEFVDDLFVDVDAAAHQQSRVLGDVIDDAVSEHRFIRTLEKSPLDESYAPVRVADVPRVDEFGIQTGVTEEWIPIFTPDGFEDGIRVSGKAGDEALVTWSQIVESDVLHTVIDEELAKIPPAYRPREIVIHFNQLVTSDGVDAFGYVEADTRRMHLSAQALFNNQPTKTTHWNKRLAIDLGDVYVGILKPDELVRQLDVDGFRKLVQHELGHTVEVGIEEQTRARLVTAVWDNFFDERGFLPDTRAELIELIRYDDLIPAGFPVNRYDDLVDAFVASRVELLEDIINTNMTVAADEIFRQSMQVGDMPKWMARAYNDVLRNEPNAYHEFFAEVFSRVLVEGGDDAALQKVAREMLGDKAGISEIRALLDRSIDELPEMIGWDVDDPIFQRWLRAVLDERAPEIIPRNRSVNRRLWKLKEPVAFELEHLADDINAQLVAVDSYGGGATIHIVTGEVPTHGTAVARHANERIIENVKPGDVAKEIERFLNRAANRKFLDQEQWYLGLWLEPDGTLTIDVTMMFDDSIDAAIFGFKEQQRSAFNFTTGQLEQYLDDYDDFDAWFAVRGREILAEEGVELTEDLYNAITQRVGAAYVSLKEPARREIRGKGGKHLPIGMEALKYDEVGTAKIHYNARTRYVIGEADEAGDLLPTGERLVITKESIKENLTRVLEYADNEYGLVDRSLSDADWIAARNIAIKSVDVPQSELDDFVREIREAYDMLDRMGITAPGKLLDAGQYHDPRLVTFSIESGTKMRKYGVSQIGGKVAPNGASTRGYTHINRSWKDLPGTMATSRQETILHEIAHQLDTRGVLGTRLRRLGFEPSDISPYASLNDDEFFAEAFLALMTGRADPKLVEAMLGYSFDTVEKLTTTGILDVDRGAALRILHRFYEDWNRKYKAVAEETGIPMKKLVGVAAIISPGMYAESNRDAAAFMIKTIADDTKIWGAKLTRYKQWLQQRADNIRTESRKKNNGRVTAKAEKAAKSVEQMKREAVTGRLSEFGDTETAYALAFLARDSGLMISETRSMTLTGRYGMRQVIDATKVITGTSTLDDALGDTKTRSFFNNIMDPKDIYRAGDVTVDFHMDNASGMVIGMQNLHPAVNSSVLGMSAGLRPLIGDIVRELYDEGWGDRVHSDSPAELQEVIWAIFRAATSTQRRGEQWFGELKTVMYDPEWSVLSNEDLRQWIRLQENL